MIDVQTENLISPKDACRMIPGRSGHGISRATLWRWMLPGRRGVKLDSCLVGGVRYTSRQAVARFVAELNAAPETHQEVARQLRETTTNAKTVEKQLAAEGL
jgi:hypothetical protein